MKAFKGFNGKLQCTPSSKVFQYEIGGEYQEESASVCNCGFHACENPLDTFNYYEPGDSRYCEVELEDVVRESSQSDTKVAAKRIKIGAEIGILGIIRGAVKFVFEKTEASENTVSTTGDDAHAATTGNRAHAATTGNRAHAATTGNRAHAATTGDDAHAATTGNRAHAATTGYGADAEVKGENSIAAALGINAHAKGSLGSWIVCAEWQEIGWCKYELLCVKTAQVDGERILPDVWYGLKDGEFVPEEIKHDPA